MPEITISTHTHGYILVAHNENARIDVLSETYREYGMQLMPDTWFIERRFLYEGIACLIKQKHSVELDGMLVSMNKDNVKLTAWRGTQTSQYVEDTYPEGITVE